MLIRIVQARHNMGAASSIRKPWQIIRFNDEVDLSVITSRLSRHARKQVAEKAVVDARISAKAWDDLYRKYTETGHIWG